MEKLLRILTLMLLISFVPTVRSQDIFRFDHIGSEDGLSQNTAFSILFDSKGFMWIGTYNGLNRYDGYEFKIFRSSPGNPSSFTNNRIVNLWEDERGFIWLETYDGYYHFFNPVTEVFRSIPLYEGPDVHNGAMKVFLQYSDDIIFLGSSETGLYMLRYNNVTSSYDVRQYTIGRENHISSNNIRFIHKDFRNNVWIGTPAGINYLPEGSISQPVPEIEGKNTDLSFTSVCETSESIWLGTEARGILVFDKASGDTGMICSANLPELKSDRITDLYHTRSGYVVAGFSDKGLMLTKNYGKTWQEIGFHSKNLDNIYEDRYNQLWLTAIEFGVTRLDPENMVSHFYVLTPEEIKPLTDLERPQFYEDSRDNLWLGVHGSGLGFYDRKNDVFRFYRNDPEDLNTISSNFIHCVTEDKTGQLWIGTGQVAGGVEKVIRKNEAFQHYLLEEEPADILDNVARAILEDQNKSLWVATKAGKIHLFDSTQQQKKVFYSLPGTGRESYRNITYSLYHDSRGYLWIGSKGYGLSVSTKPLGRNSSDYDRLTFTRFVYSATDSTTIGNNNIYSICEDSMKNIWIGTYGNGLSLISHHERKKNKIVRINQKNSNLSNDLIRHLMVDSEGNLWIATTFGLNLLEKKNIESGNFTFRVFLKNPSDDKSLGYNDIIHIFEDSGGRIWLGTFGAGIDLLEEYKEESAVFRHYGADAGPGYGIIYGLLEDPSGKIWASTENGLICLDPATGKTEIYNMLSGLGFNSFSENTCFTRKDGTMVFGGYLGFETIDAEKLVPKQNKLRAELTKFLLFNKEVSTGQKDTPLSKSISFTEELELKHFQSSFSIDFSALDFLDPQKVQYSYRLDNFEDKWNNVGNQHRATYTNLSPGRYIFRVKSIRDEGKSVSPERILNIRISPPWWKTPPAYLLYVMLIALVTTLVFNAVRRINRYKNDLAIEKKVNELKLQFYTNISHEIRTPLTLIIGPLEDLIAEKSLSAGKKLQIGITLKNAKRMLHLTNQLLDFRKIQNNKMILKIRKIDIVAFTREIFESFGPLVQHKGINCTFESDFISFIIYADPAKLDVMIYNLISNAVKFTSTGKNVSVGISDSIKKNSVDISVADEGPGIPQRNLEDIFTRYTILSNQDLSGTGIGLSLSYELAKLHRGDILISSIPGKGSTFTIRLLKGNDHFKNAPGTEMEDTPSEMVPYIHSGIPYENVEVEKPVHPSDHSDRHLMLVVEDNNEILEYICQSLKSFFNTVGAKNGEEGLHLAKTLNPDIIITDIKMPGISGIEMTSQLKESFETSHIPVIMLTAKGEVKDQIEGIETGAEAYIVKPFNMEYLKTVAQNLLNQRAKVMAYFLNTKSNGTETVRVTSKDGEFLRRTIKFIEENYSVDFPINHLAEHCNVSRTVLYNKLKGLTGFGPAEFIRKMKLDHASRLLENGFNVSEAAYKTGFSDVKYFSRLFKMQFGYVPSKYKNGK